MSLKNILVNLKGMNIFFGELRLANKKVKKEAGEKENNE